MFQYMHGHDKGEGLSAHFALLPWSTARVMGTRFKAKFVTISAD